MNNSITIVTGLWDMGRGDLKESFRRDFGEYKERFAELLQIDQNMVIYAPKYLESMIWRYRERYNTVVIKRELEDFRQWFPFFDRVQEIRNSDSWRLQLGEGSWLSESTQACLEYYNPVIMSKMFMLSDASIHNHFGSDNFIWLDAGLTRTVHSLSDKRVWENISKYIDPFLFMSYPYKASTEVHGFSYPDINKYAGGEDVQYVCRGGLFGGKREFIREANALYYSLLSSTLSEGYMGTEESIFAIMAHLYPDSYRRFDVGGHGMIANFVEALISGNVETSESDIRKRVLTDICGIKTDLYFLAFKYREQLRPTMLSCKEWIDKANKVYVVDNSLELADIAGIKELCDEFGAEHIVMGRNAGISGGRQFVADHFNGTDADFYVFFEDDMTMNGPDDTGFCRCGFRKYVVNLWEAMHKIIIKEEFDYIKLSFTEVFLDNYFQVAWYNVPQEVRDVRWPGVKLPVQGLDYSSNAPRTKIRKIDAVDGLAYAEGEVGYCNWPLLFSKAGNQRVFLKQRLASPHEQTWSSYVYQQQIAGKVRAGVLLASPITHNRFVFYEGAERKES